MINPKYGVNCLKIGYERYKSYNKLPISIELSQTTVSFYVKIPTNPKGRMSRVSDHHPSLQNLAKCGEPWLYDNISIEFIIPNSYADNKQYKARVYQDEDGRIKPFDITTYQYDSTLIEPNDLTTIFNAIKLFLQGKGYSDPFQGTPKHAKVISRHSNIKPYKPKPMLKTNIRVDGNGNSVPSNLRGADYISESIDIYRDSYQLKNRNIMKTTKKRIRLTESELTHMIAESVKRVLNETCQDIYRRRHSEII